MSDLRVLKRAECRSVRSQVWTPFTSTNYDHDEKILAVICGNSRLTVREVADDVGNSIGPFHRIFPWKNFICFMCRVNAKFVSRLLTIRKSAVLKSVRNCLPTQMGVKTSLKTPEQEMRLRPRRALRYVCCVCFVRYVCYVRYTEWPHWLRFVRDNREK